MSLQGSLDSFALPDVLVLLASTKKSGELHIAGSRTASPGHPTDLEGRIWLRAGQIAGCDVARAKEPADAVFELLRLVEGTFSFAPGAGGDGAGVEVEPVITEAQARLAEWREIEAVVPSLAHWLDLAPEPPAAHVAMRADQWRLIVVVAGGCSVDAALDRMHLDELPGCRAVKEAVEAGLLRIAADAPAGAATNGWGDSTSWSEAGWDSGHTLAAPAAEPVETAAAAETTFEWAPARDEDEPRQWEAPAWQAEAADDPVPAWVDAAASPAPVVDVADEPVAEAVPDWRSDLGNVTDLDSLASMPSRPRRRTGDVPEPGQVTIDAEDDVAAAGADTDVDDGDEPLNRGLLLKFLSSVRN